MAIIKKGFFINTHFLIRKNASTSTSCYHMNMRQTSWSTLCLDLDDFWWHKIQKYPFFLFKVRFRWVRRIILVLDWMLKALLNLKSQNMFVGLLVIIRINKKLSLYLPKKTEVGVFTFCSAITLPISTIKSRSRII